MTNLLAIASRSKAGDEARITHYVRRALTLVIEASVGSTPTRPTKTIKDLRDQAAGACPASRLLVDSVINYDVQ